MIHIILALLHGLTKVLRAVQQSRYLSICHVHLNCFNPSFPLLWILFLPFANKSIFNPPSISNLILMSLAADDQLFVKHSLLLCVKYANGGVWHETDIRGGLL